MNNTSGKGKEAKVPEGVRGWSWGAFLLHFIWGIGNRTWIALLMFVPLVNAVMIFVLGFKGREWAWRNRPWRDMAHFERVQRNWSIAGLALYAALAVCIALLELAAWSYANR